MKTLINPIQFLTTDIVKQCFDNGKTHFIDKQATGNGFTTGFGKLRPSRGRVNILVAPNQKVVSGKQESYKKEGGFGWDDNGKKLRVGFVYEKNGLRGNIRDYDLILYVADSFYYSHRLLKGKIDKLLIDECHSFFTQTDFRFTLKRAYNLIDQLEDKETSISFLTASPLLKTEITIKIENEGLEWRDINLSQNVRKSINRAAEKIIEGRNVNIYTNEASVACFILKASKTNSFDLIAGDSFKTTLLSKGQFKLNEKSNIRIVSTTGFEGWDDYSKKENAAAFMFVNLGAKHATFLGSNIYQAFGRFRNGSAHDELCVIDAGGCGFPNKFIDDLDGKLDSFIKSKEPEESEEKKQSKNFTFRHGPSRIKCRGIDYHKFLDMEALEGKLIIKKFAPTKMVHDEKFLINKNLNVYDRYFKERKIKLKPVNDVIQTSGAKKTTNASSRVSNIIYALENNDLNHIFYDFFFKKWKPNETEDSAIQQIRDLKNYYIDELEVMIQVAEGAKFELKEGVRELLKFYYDFIAINPEENPDCHHKTLTDMFEAHLKRKEYTTRTARKKRQKFNEFGLLDILEMAKQMVFKEKTSSYVVHRDYNTYTKMGLTTIKFVADLIGVEIIEVDIKNCFIRILYALNGLPLPDNFYDIPKMSRQKAKTTINMTINNFFFDSSKGKTSKKKQKYRAKQQFEKLNFHPEVIDYLLENWFDPEYRGDLFNFLSFHEQNIINGVKSKIREEIKNSYQQYNERDKFKEDIFMVRRHDSLVFFFRKINLVIQTQKDYKYLDQIGWF